MRVELPEKITPVFQGDYDYRGAYGGRGGAKTIAFANMAIVDIMRLAEEPWIFLCGRELQKSLKDSVFKVISGQIIKLGVQDAFDVGKEYIRCKNGNEFLFYGLKSNIAEVKGLHAVRRTWLEEAQKVSQNSLTYLIPTVMRDFPDCELWATWNPDDEEDPIHTMFVDNADDETNCVKINYDDNPWFPESLNKARLRDKKNNPDRYGWIWNGSFNTNSDAAVYGKWMEKARQEGRIVDKGLFEPELAVFTVWDIGYSDYTAIWWVQISGNEIRIIDFFEDNRENIKTYCEQIYGRLIPDESIIYGVNGKIEKFKLGEFIEGCEHRKQYQYSNHFGPHDARNKLLQAGGRSMVDQMYELGIKMKAINSTSQQNQIQGARNVIDKCYFDSERCPEGIRALKKYQFKYNDDKGTYSKEPDHDFGGFSHACDAFEIISQVWRTPDVRKPIDKNIIVVPKLTAKDVFTMGAPKSVGSKRI